MTLPQHNARLTAIAGGGHTETYGHPGDAPAKWTGDVDVYVVDQIHDDVQGAALEQLATTELVMPLLPDVTIVPRDVVTYDAGAGAVSREVKLVLAQPALGRIRLHLRDA